LALLSALTVGYTFPQLGLVAADWNIPLFSTTGIFILQVRLVQLQQHRTAVVGAQKRGYV
jgi:hypothetical protein